MYPLLAILSLGFLIVVHEGRSHYFVARWCGMPDRAIQRRHRVRARHLQAPLEEDRHGVPDRADSHSAASSKIRGMNIAEDVDPGRSSTRIRNRPFRVAAVHHDLRRARHELPLGGRARVRALHSCHGAASRARGGDGSPSPRCTKDSGLRRRRQARGRRIVESSRSITSRCRFRRRRDHRIPPTAAQRFHGGSLVQRVNDKHGEPRHAQRSVRDGKRRFPARRHDRKPKLGERTRERS